MNQKDMLQTIAKALGVTLTKENDPSRISNMAFEVWQNLPWGLRSTSASNGITWAEFKLAVMYYRAEALLNEIESGYEVS